MFSHHMLFLQIKIKKYKFIHCFLDRFVWYVYCSKVSNPISIFLYEWRGVQMNKVIKFFKIQVLPWSQKDRVGWLLASTETHIVGSNQHSLLVAVLDEQVPVSTQFQESTWSRSQPGIYNHHRKLKLPFHCYREPQVCAASLFAWGLLQILARNLCSLITTCSYSSQSQTTINLTMAFPFIVHLLGAALEY